MTRVLTPLSVHPVALGVREAMIISMKHLCCTVAILLLCNFLSSVESVVQDSEPDPDSGAAEESVQVQPAVLPAGYQLYPGDQVLIQVFDHPELETRMRIPAHGTIGFPLIGDVDGVVGRRLDEVAREIRERLEDGYIRQAILSTTVLEFGKRRAVVMGSVPEATVIELSPFARITAAQALAEAGGFSDDADRTACIVIRENPQNPGSKTIVPVPNLDEPDGLFRDLTLLPYDILLVPRLDRVYILGQVRHPGAVNLPSREPLTVSKAISLVGGFEKFARESEVQLIREGRSMNKIDVRAILMGQEGSEDTRLRPGDTIYVPESRF